jgi:hypothetical protein
MVGFGEHHVPHPGKSFQSCGHTPSSQHSAITSSFNVKFEKKISIINPLSVTKY